MLERACSRLDSISWKLLSAPPTNRATNFPIGLIGDPCAGDIIVRRGLEFLLDGKRGWKNGTKRGGGGNKGRGIRVYKIASKSGGNGYKRTDGRE